MPVGLINVIIINECKKEGAQYKRTAGWLEFCVSTTVNRNKK